MSISVKVHAKRPVSPGSRSPPSAVAGVKESRWAVRWQHRGLVDDGLEALSDQRFIAQTKTDPGVITGRSQEATGLGPDDAAALGACPGQRRQRRLAHVRDEIGRLSCRLP